MNVIHRSPPACAFQNLIFLDIQRKTKLHVLLLLLVLTPVHLNWSSFATGKCNRSPRQLISTMNPWWLYITIHFLTIFKWKMRNLRLNLIYLSFFVHYTSSCLFVCLVVLFFSFSHFFIYFILSLRLSSSVSFLFSISLYTSSFLFVCLVVLFFLFSISLYTLYCLFVCLVVFLFLFSISLYISSCLLVCLIVNTKELIHCHCGTYNRAPRWTFTDPCKPEVRPGAWEESVSPAWLAAPAMNARDTTSHSHNTQGKRHNNTWVEPLAGNYYQLHTAKGTSVKKNVKYKRTDALSLWHLQ